MPNVKDAEAAEFVLTFPAETAEAVREAYNRSRVILEYGTGGSTRIAASRKDCTIVAVESDKDWLDRLVASLEGSPGRVLPVHVDIGPTGKWGRPVGNEHFANFPQYAIQPWKFAKSEGLQPELVLIDGRFRVACFIATLIFTDAPVEIIFDDYRDRPHYHSVERFLKPEQLLGRAALFQAVPGTITARDVADEIAAFLNFA